MCPSVTPEPRGAHTYGMTCAKEDRPGESPMEPWERLVVVWQGIKESQVPWVRSRTGRTGS